MKRFLLAISILIVPVAAFADMPVPADLAGPQVVVPDTELAAFEGKTERLRGLFNRVTAGATTDDQKVSRFVTYVQEAIYHPAWAPIDTAGTAVYDPIWILTNRLGHCGQTNRVLVDAFLAVGYQSRLVQLKGHVAAEVYYAGDWHYVDADVLSVGDEIRDANGDIPSAREIAADPSLVAHIVPFREAQNYPNPPTIYYTDYARVFEPQTYGSLTTPYVYVKTATPAQLNNKYYGWNYYRAEAM